MEVIRTCPLCQTENTLTIDVTLQQFFNWSEGGALIQNAMPSLTPDEREHIKTGICGKCWPSEEDKDAAADWAIADMESIIDALDRNPPK